MNYQPRIADILTAILRRTSVTVSENKRHFDDLLHLVVKLN